MGLTASVHLALGAAVFTLVAACGARSSLSSTNDEPCAETVVGRIVDLPRDEQIRACECVTSAAFLQCRRVGKVAQDPAVCEDFSPSDHDSFCPELTFSDFARCGQAILAAEPAEFCQARLVPECRYVQTFSCPE